MKTSNELDQLRDEIRAIDKELVDLFEKRMKLSREVGQCKIKAEIPIYDAKREDENLEHLVALIKEVKDKTYFATWYHSLMDISKAIQHSVKKKK